MINYHIREASAADARLISILVETSFEGTSEARVIQGLRDEGAVELELVAVEDGHIIGHAAFPRLMSPKNWLALAPLTVRTDRREMGIGSRLVREGIERLRGSGAPAMLVLGDPAYYERFGFSVDAAKKLRSAYPKNNLMMMPFEDGLQGVEEDVFYPSPFLRI